MGGANFSSVLSIACGGNIFENEFYKFLLVSTGFFSFRTDEAHHPRHYGCDLPTPHWLLVF